MCGFIAEVNAELGVTVVLIEHDIGVVMSLSDHVVVLDYGRRSATGRRTRCDGPGSSQPISARRTEGRHALWTGLFLEMLVGGLLAGVMYSTGRDRFRTDLQASGVFNFAQGAMVLFAALTFVTLPEHEVPFLLALAVTGG